MSHPLTDEMIDEISVDGPEWHNPYDEDDIRAAYDKGFDDAIKCIREAGLAHYSALDEAQENFYKLSQQQEDS